MGRVETVAKSRWKISRARVRRAYTFQMGDLEYVCGEN